MFIANTLENFDNLAISVMDLAEQFRLVATSILVCQSRREQLQRLSSNQKDMLQIVDMVNMC